LLLLLLLLRSDPADAAAAAAAVLLLCRDAARYPEYLDVLTEASVSSPSYVIPDARRGGNKLLEVRGREGKVDRCSPTTSCVMVVKAMWMDLVGGVKIVHYGQEQ
jgi:hypothetical protein